MNKEQQLVLSLVVVIALFAAVMRLRTTGFWTALTTKQPNPSIQIGTPLGPITLFGSPPATASTNAGGKANPSSPAATGTGGK